MNKLLEHKILTGNKLGAKFALQSFELFTRPTIVDYLKTGWSVSLVAAIDFTASNGDPRNADSNHSLQKEVTDYEKALYDVGTMINLEENDDDHKFQVFGFGGIPRYLGLANVNHCFAVNGDPKNPEILGIQNVLAAYRQALTMTDLAGPTLFGPLLQQFYSFMK